MGDQNSSNNAGASQWLWKTQRAILSFPITSNLEALSVLANNNGSYRHIGNVISLSKPGTKLEWLKQKFDRSKQKQVLPTRCITNHPITISGNQATVIANRLGGPSNSSSSIEVFIPECWVREPSLPDWEEVIDNFTPKNSIRELFIVQKVILAPEIKIVDRSTGTVVVIRENQMLPIGFSGYKYSYDKFGNLLDKSSQMQHDSAKASSSHSEEEDEEDEGDEGDEGDEDEDDEEDDPTNDVHMGGFLDSEDDWLANIGDDYTQTGFEIYYPIEEDDDPAAPPSSPPGSPPGAPPRDQDDID